MIKQNILSIAALDTSGGAGINQDIRVSSLLGYQIYTCLTGITIQTKNGVEAIYPLSDNELLSQLTSLLSSKQIKYIKIGALCSINQVKIITGILTKPHNYIVVLDPVLKPSKGLSFISDEDIDTYMQIISIVDVLTPNWNELSWICEVEINNFESAISAASTIAKEYRIRVLVKGGHGKDDYVTEAYVSKSGCYTFQKERQNWKYEHGTGCALSMAYTCLLANGDKDDYAFKKASQWVSELYRKLNS